VLVSTALLQQNSQYQMADITELIKV